MLKLKSISLIAAAAIMCFPGNSVAEDSPVKQAVNAAQQNGKVRGTIQDDLGPVTGASLLIVGTSNGTITNLDGEFTLEGLKNGDVIRVSFVGYVTQEITWQGQTDLAITLIEDSQALDEVVVTALGTI